MTPSERNDIARQLERLADEVKDLKMGLSAHKPVYTNAELMKLLDTSTATIKKWRDAGLLGYSQVETPISIAKRMSRHFSSASIIKLRQSPLNLEVADKFSLGLHSFFQELRIGPLRRCNRGMSQ